MTMNVEFKIENGALAPDFSLADINGALHELIQYRGRIVILNFWSAECPWSEHSDRRLLQAAQEWDDEMVAILFIASNANESIDLIRQVAEERNLPLVLVDTDHQVADLYGAVTTPQVFLLDPSGHVRYQGAIDDATFRKQEPENFYVYIAVERLIAGLNPEPGYAPPYGCAIVREQ